MRESSYDTKMLSFSQGISKVLTCIEVFFLAIK